MESRNARARKSLRLAALISLLLHAAVLFIGFSSSTPRSGSAENHGNSTRAALPGLIATFVRPAKPLPLVPPLRRRKAEPLTTIGKRAGPPEKQAEQRKLTASNDAWKTRSWSSAERADMNKFLQGLSPQPKPPTGDELVQRSLAMARQFGRYPQGEAGEETPERQTANGKAVEPFSMEMYFDAFVRKLNRSAAFVPYATGVRGSRKALVRISLNADGSLKSYRVLRAADQGAVIDYIKRVVERASPFSAFPPDIRNVRDSLSILMCIYPAHAGEGGGFSRSLGAQDCQD